MRDKGGLGLIEHFSLIYLGKTRGGGRNVGISDRWRMLKDRLFY